MRCASEADNGLSNLRGTVSTVIAPGEPDSFTTGFLIHTGDNTFLDFDPETGIGNTVFGRVDAGFDVLATIEQIPVLTPDLLDPVIITSIRRFTPTGLEPIEPE